MLYVAFQQATNSLPASTIHFWIFQSSFPLFFSQLDTIKNSVSKAFKQSLFSTRPPILVVCRVKHASTRYNCWLTSHYAIFGNYCFKTIYGCPDVCDTFQWINKLLSTQGRVKYTLKNYSLNGNYLVKPRWNK